MISERLLSENFQGFWDEIVPLLTSSFVKVFNEAYRKEIRDDQGQPVSAIPVGTGVIHNDVVAEVAFHMAKLTYERKIDISTALEDVHLKSSAVDSVRKNMKQVVRSITSELYLNEDEWEEVRHLCFVYEAFLKLFHNRERIEFSPVIPGAGFLGTCSGDLSVDSILFEIKTVNRNIARKDIRQLIIYLALQAATGERRWKRAGFFNPRKALYYIFSVDQLMIIVSGGRSASEVFQEVIDFLGVRDTQIDTAF